MSDPIAQKLRREAQERIDYGGMQAGLPKLRVDAGSLLLLLDRYDQLRAENERLLMLFNELGFYLDDDTPDDLLNQVRVALAQENDNE